MKRFIKFNPFKIYILIVLAAVLPYFYGINGDFVYDDIALIAEEPFYTSSDASYFDCWQRTYWQGVQSVGQYRPLVGFSYLLNERITGLNSSGFRFINLILHILVSMLIFKLGLRLRLGSISAMFAALLYAVHPIHTEAVIPSSGRAELLCTLFILTGFIAFLRILHSGEGKSMRLAWWVYAIPPVSLILANWSKENGIVLIPLCLLYDVLYRPFWKNLLHEKMGLKTIKESIFKLFFTYIWLFIASLVIVAVKLINIGSLMPVFQGRMGVEIDNPLFNASIAERLCTTLKIQGMVFVKYFYPAHLSHDYSFAELLPVDNIYNLYALFALAMFILMPFFLCRVLPGFRKIILFLTLAYILSILPAGNFIVLTGTIFGERLYYTPSIWFFIGGVFVLIRIAQKISREYFPQFRPFWIYIVCGCFFIAIAAAGIRTYFRSKDWESQLTLSLKGAETAPGSIKTWANLAVQMSANGQLDDAVICCDKGLAIYSCNMMLLRNKVSYLIRLKRYNEAEKSLRELIRLRTNSSDDFKNLAFILAGKWKLKEAAGLLEHSLKMNPEQDDVRKGLELMREDIRKGKSK